MALDAVRAVRDGASVGIPHRSPVEEVQARVGRPAHQALDEIKSEVARKGAVTAADEARAALAAGVPVASVHGAVSYYADLHQPRGRRHVRVCAGTACFVASGGGRHIAQVADELAVAVGERSADGAVSLQPVHCLGYCFGGPAALDGAEPRVGADVAEQIAGRAAPRAPEIPVYADTAPVVLRGVLDGDPAWQTWAAVLEQGGAQRVIHEVEAAGLRGRGGAGFPAAQKWAAVAREGDGGRRYVVANGDEGDPGSFADRLLMERDPSRVLEGLALAGLACGAGRGFVYVRSEYPHAFESVQAAVAEAREAGHLGRDVHGSGVDFDVEVASGAGSYVAGEETSLLRSLAGLRGTVRPRPPYPTRYGLLGRPTAVNNVETLCAVPAIVSDGGQAYARRGAGRETGTLLVCLNERFVRPGAYEVEFGISLGEIVERLGGGLRDGGMRAVQVGGPLGGFLGPADLDLPLLESALSRAGGALGHGSLVAIDDRVQFSDLLRHFWEFAANETCGACTPCREGTRRGAAHPAEASRDESLLHVMGVASLCAFGRAIPRTVRSLLRAYGRELG
jgi:NADH:ubiquinone oxidoreductase subunit F (NADH-binding)/NADH:ubiquinone oxidoreductase subunit E